MRSFWIVLFCCAFIMPVSLAAKTYVDLEKSVAIDPARGVDELVDYNALVQLGPWDDRNYQLTLGDLALLPANEKTIHSLLPAFMRVEVRKSLATFGDRSDVRYPMSAFNVFRNDLGGYLVNGKYYRGARRAGERYFVSLQGGIEANPDRPGADESIDAVTGEVRITNPVGAAESAIAINPTDATELIAGSNGPSGGQRMHYSKDGGANWTQVDLPLGGSCCDPTVEWSTDGQYAYTSTLGCFFVFCDLWFYRSDDGGVTWTSLEDITPGSPRREVANGADREFMHVDQSPDSPFKDNIYLAYHNSNVLRIARSTDFGNTWTAQAFGSESDERGIAGDIATDKDGAIYYAWPAFNSKTIRLRKSTDGGEVFAATQVITNTNASFSFPIPAVESREVAVYIAADTDRSNGPYANSVYLAWADATAPETSDPQQNHAHVQVAYSRDGGSTWTLSTPHETDDEQTVDRWQTFLEVGPDGVVHVIYYDTRRSPDRSAADVFYAYSTDGAQTWSAPRRVTSEMSPNILDGFEFGDYSGLDIVMDDLVAIFTDNRNEAGGGGDSIDVYFAGIEPGSASAAAPGRIRGAKGVSGSPLTLSKTGGDLTLDWSAVCGAGTDYAIYEGVLPDIENKTQRMCSTGGSTTATLTPGADQRFYLVVATDGGAEGSYGQASDDTERTPSAAPCHPQDIGPCP